MSESICGRCRLPIHPGESGLRYSGLYVSHAENRCVSLLQAEVERLTAELERHKSAVAEVQRMMSNDGPSVDALPYAVMQMLKARLALSALESR